jgi:hypothetical protein
MTPDEQKMYDKCLDAFWESFRNWKPNWIDRPAPWLPAHDFPPEPEISEYPATITLRCIHPECGAENTYTRHSFYLTSTKGFIDPFVCRRPDPRQNKENTNND